MISTTYISTNSHQVSGASGALVRGAGLRAERATPAPTHIVTSTQEPPPVPPPPYRILARSCERTFSDEEASTMSVSPASSQWGSPMTRYASVYDDLYASPASSPRSSYGLSRNSSISSSYGLSRNTSISSSSSVSRNSSVRSSCGVSRNSSIRSSCDISRNSSTRSRVSAGDRPLSTVAESSPTESPTESPREPDLMDVLRLQFAIEASLSPSLYASYFKHKGNFPCECAPCTCAAGDNAHPRHLPCPFRPGMPVEPCSGTRRR